MISGVGQEPSGPRSSSLERDPRAVAADPSDVAPGDIAIGVIIGRTSEYFDYFVYGIASVLVFPAIFFPFESRLDGTLYSFTIFSFAFIARPIGSVVFMDIQRRWGRGTKLTLALFLLGSSTAGIAFLPGYGSLGYMAIVWQLGAPVGFMLASGLYLLLYASLSLDDFLSWGWRYPFFCAFAINVVALFARLRLVVTSEFDHLLTERELEPTTSREVLRSQGYNVILGAFGALASYALFHVVTVFPLSWIILFSKQSVTAFLAIQILAAMLGACGVVASGIIADHIGRRKTLGLFATLIAVFSGFAPTLLDGGTLGQDVFILIGFGLLGLSYGQAAGALNASFEPKYRYTGAALTSDVAWLIGAGFAPLVALGTSAYFGLGYVSLYLLSGAAGTLAALWVNRRLEESD